MSYDIKTLSDIGITTTFGEENYLLIAQDGYFKKMQVVDGGGYTPPSPTIETRQVSIDIDSQALGTTAVYINESLQYVSEYIDSGNSTTFNVSVFPCGYDDYYSPAILLRSGNSESNISVSYLGDYEFSGQYGNYFISTWGSLNNALGITITGGK